MSFKLGKLSQAVKGGKMNVVWHVRKTVAHGDRFCMLIVSVLATTEAAAEFSGKF
ncbi:MAG: hypothetical protein HRF47_12530 [Chloroflexota bacterium]|jgi:hypothetical protein